MKKLLLCATLLIINYSLNATTTANGTKTRMLKDDNDFVTVCWEVDAEQEQCASFRAFVLEGLMNSFHPARKSEGNTCLWLLLHDNAKPQSKSLNKDKAELSEQEFKELFPSFNKQ